MTSLQRSLNYFLDPFMLKTGKWLSQSYLCSPAQCLGGKVFFFFFRNKQISIGKCRQASVCVCNNKEAILQLQCHWLIPGSGSAKTTLIHSPPGWEATLHRAGLKVETKEGCCCKATCPRVQELHGDFCYPICCAFFCP